MPDAVARMPDASNRSAEISIGTSENFVPKSSAGGGAGDVAVVWQNPMGARLSAQAAMADRPRFIERRRRLAARADGRQAALTRRARIASSAAA